ncbi:MAG: ABC transporter permease subunit [Alphaproteobacteria bacterium]|nr:ABC transporter permease subunit [Alphaproteobacteria bacterium]
MTSPATSSCPPYRPRLWRNEGVRAVGLQVFVVFAFFAIVAWLIGNVAANFAALDKTFSFRFLWELPAGYDINQTLIDYTNQDSHLRAAFVGLLNTGVVAVVGIFLATVLGFSIGILRLSSNWLVSRMAYVYVEFTRNTPVLLLILLWHGIIINTLPHPRQALSLGGSVFISNRGFYVPAPVTEPGFWWIALVFCASLVVAGLIYHHGRRYQKQTGKHKPYLVYGIGLFIALTAFAFYLTGTPVTLDRPALRGFNYQGGMTLIPEFVALTWALAFYTSGFIAENVRSGIVSVDRGQTDAARALGLTENRTMKLVILPQAMRVIVPPLTSSYLDLMKNSSLAIAIGYMDLVATLGGITLTQTGREMEAMLLVMLIYLTISLSISWGMNIYNNRQRLVER